MSYKSSLLSSLSLDNLIQIAIADLTIWNTLSVTVPKFGRYTLTEEAKTLVRKLTQYYECKENQGILVYRNGLCIKVEGTITLNEESDNEESLSNCLGSDFGPDDILRYGNNRIFTWKNIKYYYTLSGILHREDGPAFERTNGLAATKIWYRHGIVHRKDGPAIEHFNGKKQIEKEEWWYYGKRHREDGPAIIYNDGLASSKEWYFQGMRHRIDGPATEYKDGSKYWYLNGKRHRENGPAIEEDDGTKTWYHHGKLHRIDGPAIEYANGDKEWCIHDERHRTDGPAIEYFDGYKAWYINGERHRTDGPAVELPDGRKTWFLHGVEVPDDNIC